MNTLAKQYQLRAEEFHTRLKNRREKTYYTQDDLADDAGIQRGIIVKAECGYTDNKGIRKYPRPKTAAICKIADVLGTTPAYLEYGSYSIVDENLIELCNVLLKLNVTERNEFIDKAIIKLKSP